MNLKLYSNCGSVIGSLNYQEGRYDSKGVERAEAPEYLAGMEPGEVRAGARLLGSCGCNDLCTFANGYEECPPMEVRRDVMNIVFSFLTAGIAPWDVLTTAISHWKEEPANGWLSADDHGLVVKTILSSGRVFQPYYFKRDRADFLIVQEYINYRYGFSSPLDPSKFRVAHPARMKGDVPFVRDLKRRVGDELLMAIEAGSVGDQSEVVAWLNAQRGVLSAVPHKKSVGITTPQGHINLRAYAFEARFDPGKIEETRNKRTRKEQAYYEDAFPRRLEARARRQSQEVYGDGALNRFGVADLDIQELLDLFRERKESKKKPEHGPLNVPPIVLRDPFWALMLQQACAPIKASGLPSPEEVQLALRRLSMAMQKIRDNKALNPEEAALLVLTRFGYRLSRDAAEILSSGDRESRSSCLAQLEALNDYLGPLWAATSVKVAAEFGTMNRLSRDVVERLDLKEFSALLENGKAVFDALVEQGGDELLFEGKPPLLPDLLHSLAKCGLAPNPSLLSAATCKTLAAPKVMNYCGGGPIEKSTAQILFADGDGGEWVSMIPDAFIESLFTDEELEVLEMNLGKLIPVNGRSAEVVLSVREAELRVTPSSIVASGGLNEVLKRGLTPAASSLKTAVDACNKMDELQTAHDQLPEKIREPEISGITKGMG